MFCLLAAWRLVESWRDTMRVAGEWKRTGRAWSIDGRPQPAWTIRSPFPVVAVVGVLRPHLFVARQVVEPARRGADGDCRARSGACRGARQSRATAVSPDARCRTVREDRGSAGTGMAGAPRKRPTSRPPTSDSLELASALTKVARLASAGTPVMIPASSLIGGSDLPSRVRRLLQSPRRARRHPASWLPAAIAIALAAVAQLPPIASVSTRSSSGSSATVDPGPRSPVHGRRSTVDGYTARSTRNEATTA